MARMHPDEGRRARPAVQVFVAAANRKIGVGATQVDFDRARAVRQVPHHQRASRLGRGGDGAHVVHGAGAVVHVRQHQHRDRGVQHRRQFFGGDQFQRQPLGRAETFCDVEVGREIAALGDHEAALATPA